MKIFIFEQQLDRKTSSLIKNRKKKSLEASLSLAISLQHKVTSTTTRKISILVNYDKKLQISTNKSINHRCAFSVYDSKKHTNFESINFLNTRAKFTIFKDYSLYDIFYVEDWNEDTTVKLSLNEIVLSNFWIWQMLMRNENDRHRRWNVDFAKKDIKSSRSFAERSAMTLIKKNEKKMFRYIMIDEKYELHEDMSAHLKLSSILLNKLKIKMC